MTITPNLGLSIYDTASGSATTFLTFRLATAGLSSNFTILDSFLGDTSASIISLRANSVIPINASVISTNYYEAISSYFTGYNTNLMINLKLNATISGSATININAYGVRSLKKVNSSGTIVELINNDLITGRYYLFVYDGTQFVLGGYDVSSGGTSYSSSSPINITGSVISLSTSGVSAGNYLSANITVNSQGIITSASNGTSASSIGAPSDSPFVTSGSTSNLTNYKILTSGSNITIQSNASTIIIHSTLTSGCVYSGSSPIAIAGSIISLQTSGVISGSGNQFTVDQFGRITSSSFVSTASSSGTIYTGSSPISVGGSVISISNQGTWWNPDAKPITGSALSDEFDDSSFSGWTNFDPQGDFTYAEDVIGFHINSNGSGSTVFGGIYKEYVPNATNRTVWTKISSYPINTQIGIMIGENLTSSPSTSKILTWGWTHNADETKSFLALKSWNTYSGSVTTLLSASCVYQSPIYLSVLYGSSDIIPSYSLDGYLWRYFAQTLIGFTPKQIGLFGYASDDENISVYMLSSFFRFNTNSNPYQTMYGNRIRFIY